MPARTILSLLFAVVALAGLVITWAHNVSYFGAPGESPLDGLGRFVKETCATRAAASITIDISFVVVAAWAFFFVEARRLRMRFVWAYVLMALSVAVSLALGLFLLMRERALEKGAASGAGEPARLSLPEGIALALGLGASFVLSARTFQ